LLRQSHQRYGSFTGRPTATEKSLFRLGALSEALIGRLLVIRNTNKRLPALEIGGISDLVLEAPSLRCQGIPPFEQVELNSRDNRAPTFPIPAVLTLRHRETSRDAGKRQGGAV
jgi:hypothetical protein